MKKLTVVMPYLNEGYEPLHTLESMLDSASVEDFDVIIIDDHSTKKPHDLNSRLKDYKNVNVFRHNSRYGLPANRDYGITLAQTPNVLVIDAHMRFRKDDWLNKINNLIEAEPETLWCTICSVLNKNHLNMDRPRRKYYGADIVLIDNRSTRKRPARNIIEPKWITRKRIGDEVPCVLGANYFFSKIWWDHIKGWDGLQMWGSSEPFISLKTWLAGGKCKLCTDIEIGHIFRDNAPYVTQIWPLFYNKVFISKTVLPENIGNLLIDKLDRTSQYKKAMVMINDRDKRICEKTEYNKSIFKVDFRDYCKRFNVEIPTC